MRAWAYFIAFLSKGVGEVHWGGSEGAEICLRGFFVQAASKQDKQDDLLFFVDFTSSCDMSQILCRSGCRVQDTDSRPVCRARRAPEQMVATRVTRKTEGHIVRDSHGVKTETLLRQEHLDISRSSRLYRYINKFKYVGSVLSPETLPVFPKRSTQKGWIPVSWPKWSSSAEVSANLTWHRIKCMKSRHEYHESNLLWTFWCKHVPT